MSYWLGVFSEKYEGGLPDVEGTKDVTISFIGRELNFSFTGFLYSKKIVFSPEQIIEINLGQQKFRSAGKAATGAIIGGLLTGGIGLVAGALLGGKRRTESNLHLLIERNSNNYQVLIRSSKSTARLYSELVQFSSLSKESIPPAEVNDNNIIGIATELDKLNELLIKGALTQEEFDLMKAKIIGTTSIK